MHKTIVWVFDRLSDLSIQANMNLQGCVTFATYPTDKAVSEAMQIHDKDLQSDDLIFVCLSESASVDLLKIFSDNKYNEKVLYKNVIDKRQFRGPSMTWSDVSDLPKLIEEIGNVISEHANF